MFHSAEIMQLWNYILYLRPRRFVLPSEQHPVEVEENRKEIAANKEWIEQNEAGIAQNTKLIAANKGFLEKHEQSREKQGATVGRGFLPAQRA